MTITFEKKDNQGRNNTTMYWLVIKNNKGNETVLNVGEKTYNGVKALTEEENQPELPLDQTLTNAENKLKTQK